MPDTPILQGYNKLDPDTIINAIESLGYICDDRILALNSYENRVYQIGIEDKTPLIVKFYRPNRWSNEQLIEEHRFILQLHAQEIPVVAPIVINNESLFIFNDYRFSLYPRIGGYAPELDNSEHLFQLGRILAQIHNIGETELFEHRPDLNIEDFALSPISFLLENNFIPADLQTAYTSLTEHLMKNIQYCYERAGSHTKLRLHGDCHHGNVLVRDDLFYIVDFDDTRTGPAVQDIWMFLSGDRQYMTARLNELIEGYEEFRHFNPAELHLIEALRTLRLIHYAAWLAQRWNDPAFPIAFPFFNTQRYWEEHILNLREQIALMEEPALELFLN